MIDFAGDLARIHADVLGVDATLLPEGGTPFALRVIPRRSSPDLAGPLATPAWSRAVEVQASAADVRAGAQRDPRDGDMLTFEGATYRVKTARPADARGVALVISLQRGS